MFQKTRIVSTWIVSITIILFLTGCMHKAPSTDVQANSAQLQHTIRIDTDSIDFTPQPGALEKPSGFDLSDVRAIRLRTPDSLVAMGPVEKIFFYNKKIYCFDITRESAVSVFNNDGSFATKLSAATDEVPRYKTLIDGRINKLTGNIELLGANENGFSTFLQYDSSGKYIGSANSRFSGRLNFYPVGNKYYFYKGFQTISTTVDADRNEDQDDHWGNRLFSTDSFNLRAIKEGYLSYQNDNDLKSELPFESFSPLVTGGARDTSLLFERFNDTIYSVSQDGVKDRNLVHFVSKTDWPAGLATNNSIKNKTEYLLKNKQPILINYLENKDFILLLFSFCLPSGGRTIENALYNKRTGKITPFPNNRLLTNYEGILFELNYETFPMLMDQENGKFVSIIKPGYLIERLNQEQNENGPIHAFCKKMQLNDLSVNSNPILLLYNLRTNE
jgi:hypothetical protein